MVYEVRFQTVEPERRDDYVKMYKQAIQGCKEAGCRSGQILCSEDDSSRVMVLLEWPSKEHHLNWRCTPTHRSFPRGGGRLANQTKRRWLLPGRGHLGNGLST